MRKNTQNCISISKSACDNDLIFIQRDMAVALSATKDLQSGLRLCFDAAVKASGLDCGGIYLKDDKSGALDLVYHQGISDAFIEQVSHFEANSPNTNLMMLGKPIYINYRDLTKDIMPNLSKERLLASGIIPIKYNDEIIGCLNIASHSIKSIPIKIRGVLETIAVLIGGALARLKTESALAESESLIRSVFTSSPDSITLINFDGVLLDCNSATLKLFGFPENANLKGISIFDYVHPDEHNRVVDNIRQTIEKGALHNIEFTLLKKDGSQFAAELSSGVVNNSNNMPSAIIVVCKDISQRRTTENILLENEERYRNTFENIGASTALINENKIIVMVNSEFERLTGYSREEIENKKSWMEFVVPEDLARMLEQHHLRERDRKAALRQYEFRLITKSGDIRDIFLTVDKIPGTRDTITSLIDITERKRAEEALRLSEEKFAKAFKANPAAFAITRMKDGRIVECNNSIASLLGYEIDEVIGKTTIDINVWINVEDRNRMIAALKEGRPVHNWEVQFRAKDGSTKITQYSADILTLNNEQYILATFIDLTEMKRVQNDLIESKLKYQELFELLLEGVALLNENGKIIFCNPAFINILEANSMDQIIGKNIRDFLTEPDSESERGIRESWLKGTNCQVEIDIITIKGNKKTILVSGTPKLNQDNKLESVIVAIIDITESKKLREFASYAQRLEAAGKIAGQVAHDFNNLLAPMVAYPELIKAAIPDDGFVLGMINDIESAAKAMADINQQLLTLSRRGHYNLEVINLNDVINHAINQNSHSLESIDLITDFDPGLMNIKGGGAQILRIVSNLIANALDAMPEKGRLTIKTENYYLHKRSGITGIIPKGEYCKVSISDTGCGIAEDVIPKIFDAFFTTKVADKKRGSGLGLSVVHAVMEDHHGYIDLESKVGKGTTFYLYFPITRDVIETSAVNEIKGGTESIMIIDDDQLQRNVNANLLNRLGYKVETVDSGENALVILSKKNFDLLIIDMIMPGGMDGTETYRKSLEINPNQKGLIISGFAETDRVKEATRLGAGQFLKKPLSMKTLAAAIRDELDKKVMKRNLHASLYEP